MTVAIWPILPAPVKSAEVLSVANPWASIAAGAKLLLRPSRNEALRRPLEHLAHFWRSLHVYLRIHYYYSRSFWIAAAWQQPALLLLLLLLQLSRSAKLQQQKPFSQTSVDSCLGLALLVGIPKNSTRSELVEIARRRGSGWLPRRRDCRRRRRLLP